MLTPRARLSTRVCGALTFGAPAPALLAIAVRVLGEGAAAYLTRIRPGAYPPAAASALAGALALPAAAANAAHVPAASIARCAASEGRGRWLRTVMALR